MNYVKYGRKYEYTAVHTAGNTKSQDTQLGPDKAERTPNTSHDTLRASRCRERALAPPDGRRRAGRRRGARRGDRGRVRPHGVAPPVLAVARVQPDADPVREGPTRSAEPWVGGPPPARSARWSGIASDS